MPSQSLEDWGWEMFNINLGTAGVAIVISLEPYPFRGQRIIGTIFFILDLCIFILNTTFITRRAYLDRKRFRTDLMIPREGRWVSVSSVAIATLLSCIILYGIPYAGQWLVSACEICYWVYVCLSVTTTLAVKAHYQTVPRDISDITPPDALQVYPLMFAGVLGATLVPILEEINPSRALGMMVFSYCMLGLGWFAGSLVLGVWVVHDMTAKNTTGHNLPSHLIAVGVPGFSSLTSINLGSAALTVFPSNEVLSGANVKGLDATRVGQFIFCISIWFSLLLCGLAAWFLLGFSWQAWLFFWERPRKSPLKRWSFTWWAWIFPLTGLVGTFCRLATYLPSEAFGVLAICLTLFMVIIWFINAAGTIGLVWQGVYSPETEARSRSAVETEHSDVSN